MIIFHEPIFLWMLLGLPALMYWYHLARKKKVQAVMRFSSLALVKAAAGSSKKNMLRDHIIFGLALSILMSMILGFADPHMPLEQSNKGVSVVLAIDVSGSMMANDYPPTRLEAAKHAAGLLLEQLKPKDLAGIVVFETGASTSAFLTSYKDKAIQKLKGIAPREGRTAIGDGLSLAVDMAISVPNHQRIVVLLSDGANNAGVITPQEAVEFARANKVQVYSVGMGSDGPVVLGYDWFGNPQYAEFDEGTLKAIAEATGGKYYKSVDKDTLDSIYDTISKEIKREKEEVSVQRWFFALAFFLLLVDIYIQYGRFRVVQ